MTGEHDSLFLGLRRCLRAIANVLIVDTHPACPICGRVYYIKTMPLHLDGHGVDDPDVVAWRDRGAPRKWA